jgi:hypothetical protein
MASMQPDAWTIYLPCEEALARTLALCKQGVPPATAAAAFPDHDLAPYLELAEQLRALGRAQRPRLMRS